MWEMSCSFFGVGVGEQLLAISTEFTKSLHGGGVSNKLRWLEWELTFCGPWGDSYKGTLIKDIYSENGIVHHLIPIVMD